MRPHSAPRVAVMVRKRPLFERETTRGKQVDVVTALPMGRLAVHEPKTSVDCSKRVESSVFEFDDSFGEDATNDDVYVRAVAPLVRLCISGAEEEPTRLASRTVRRARQDAHDVRVLRTDREGLGGGMRGRTG